MREHVGVSVCVWTLGVSVHRDVCPCARQCVLVQVCLRVCVCVHMHAEHARVRVCVERDLEGRGAHSLC